MCRKFANFLITVLRAEIVTTFGSKLVAISARNTIMRKFSNFVRLYLPHITTFLNQPDCWLMEKRIIIWIRNTKCVFKYEPFVFKLYSVCSFQYWNFSVNQPLRYQACKFLTLLTIIILKKIWLFPITVVEVCSEELNDALSDKDDLEEASCNVRIQYS